MGWGAKWRALGWLVLMLTVMEPWLVAEAAGRIALVIGNGSYDKWSLKNPPNDARAMAALLRKLGFTVTEKTDLDLGGFRAQVNAFLDQSKEAEIRLFYYSGHGANYESDNYLLPIGHHVTHSYELPDQAYSVRTLLRGLKNQKGISVVLLDSCRNAPFSGDTKSLWDDNKGMTPLQPNQTGVLIGYAADQGQTASDNSSGSNSLYTKHLLEQLGQPRGLRDILMVQVRQGVYAESHNEQFPMTEDRLLGDVYLAGEPGGKIEPPPGTLVIRSSQPPGAVLVVDGKRLGPAPQTVTLKAGEHTIEAKQAGYADYRDTVHVRAGEQTALNVVLTAAPREPAPVVVGERPAPPSRPTEALIGDRYRDHGDGTVTDVKTSLQWMRCSLGQAWQGGTCVGEVESYSWQGALDAAEALNDRGGYAGHRDWRVPKIKELRTLVYCSSGQPKTWNDTGGLCGGNHQKPVIHLAAFPHTPYWFWSASPYAPYAGYARLLSFFDGGGDAFSKDLSFNAVRLVRGGQ